MKQLEPLLHRDALTCSGKTWGEVLQNVPLIENNMIRSLSNPWHPWGSLGILTGNLAPCGSVTKPIAIDETMRSFKGTAICFDSEEEATAAVQAGKIHPGMVLVIRYEGPKGGPGMREMVRIMKLLYGRNLALSTAVVTDGRFSGTNNGCFVGHISPEASEGGPIAAVCDGDKIAIDVTSGTITLEVPEAEIKQRLLNVKKPNKAIPKGFLNVYARLAESADKGAVVRNR